MASSIIAILILIIKEINQKRNLFILCTKTCKFLFWVKGLSFIVLLSWKITVKMKDTVKRIHNSIINKCESISIPSLPVFYYLINLV